MDNEKCAEVTRKLGNRLQRNKHHIIKIIIAIAVIPTLTVVLDRYILNDSIPILATMAASIGITYVLVTVYDTVITTEMDKMMEQLTRNTEDIIVIKEDIMDLQVEVFKEDASKIRDRNWERAAKRRMKGDRR